jgi:hypothetical protein
MIIKTYPTISVVFYPKILVGYELKKEATKFVKSSESIATFIGTSN